MHAVVVEDNALLRDGLSRILQAHDCSVAALPDAERLAEHVDAADVVILDVRLPPTHTTEGLVAAIALRRTRPAFPVLVLSQWVEQLYARELMAQGRSNAGIAAALVVTEKAVGKHINNIFGKLGLPMDADDNRRVLAVLRWLQDRG